MYLSAEKIDQKSRRMSDETLLLYPSAETYFILTDYYWNFVFDLLVLKLCIKVSAPVRWVSAETMILVVWNLDVDLIL